MLSSRKYEQRFLFLILDPGYRIPDLDFLHPWSRGHKTPDPQHRGYGTEVPYPNNVFFPYLGLDQLFTFTFFHAFGNYIIFSVCPLLILFLYCCQILRKMFYDWAGLSDSTWRWTNGMFRPRSVPTLTWRTWTATFRVGPGLLFRPHADIG